nr:hypothetical protein [Arenimonas daejeonensis]
MATAESDLHRSAGLVLGQAADETAVLGRTARGHHDALVRLREQAQVDAGATVDMQPGLVGRAVGRRDPRLHVGLAAADVGGDDLAIAGVPVGFRIVQHHFAAVVIDLDHITMEQLVADHPLERRLGDLAGALERLHRNGQHGLVRQHQRAEIDVHRRLHRGVDRRQAVGVADALDVAHVQAQPLGPVAGEDGEHGRTGVEHEVRRCTVDVGRNDHPAVVLTERQGQRQRLLQLHLGAVVGEIEPGHRDLVAGGQAQGQADRGGDAGQGTGRTGRIHGTCPRWMLC